MFYILIFLLGLSVGSFLNVVICRLETKEPIIRSRSRCPKCGALLKWFDLIPLISFLIQKGKCRYCGKKISWQYPLVELATGLLFLFVVLKSPLATGGSYSIATGFFASLRMTMIMEPLFFLLVICFLLVIFVYDLKHYLIPDKIVYPAIIITLLNLGAKLLRIEELSSQIYTPLLAALLSSGFFLFLVLISKGKWLGLGDVKLAGLMGLILGWPNILLALFLAFMSGAIVGITLIVAGKKTMKSQIPFGPFLAGATLVIIIFGDIFSNLSLYLFSFLW